MKRIYLPVIIISQVLNIGTSNATAIIGAAYECPQGDDIIVTAHNKKFAWKAPNIPPQWFGSGGPYVGLFKGAKITNYPTNVDAADLGCFYYGDPNHTNNSVAASRAIKFGKCHFIGQDFPPPYTSVTCSGNADECIFICNLSTSKNNPY